MKTPIFAISQLLCVFALFSACGDRPAAAAPGAAVAQHSQVLKVGPTRKLIRPSQAAKIARNGAGIRAEGAGLTIRNCRFHHNEMGLMTSNNPRGLVVIEGSEFDHNTTNYKKHGKLGHNIYIGRIRRFILRNSHVHDADVGHLVKTRAQRNDIFQNRILDGEGASSYLLDLAEGDKAEVIGNHFQQSASAQNRTAISFAAEAQDKKSGHSRLVRANSFENKGSRGVFVGNRSEAPADLQNNELQGDVVALEGNGAVH